MEKILQRQTDLLFKLTFWQQASGEERQSKKRPRSFSIAWCTSIQSRWFMWRICRNSSTHNCNCSIRSGRISSECKRSHALRVSKPSPTRGSQSLLTASSDSRAGGRICQGQVVKRTRGVLGWWIVMERGGCIHSSTANDYIAVVH